MPDRLKKRQKRAVATSEQLLIAAREVFQTNGFQGTTVGAITDAAATAHGTFYLYFRTTVARAIGGFLTVFRT